jgi:hypothetical protein
MKNFSPSPKIEHSAYAVLETVEDILDERTSNALKLYLAAENFDLGGLADKDFIVSIRTFLETEYQKDLSFKDRVKRAMAHIKRLHIISKQDINRKLPSLQKVVQVIEDTLPSDHRFQNRIRTYYDSVLASGADFEDSADMNFLKTLYGIIKDTAIEIEKEKESLVSP